MIKLLVLKENRTIKNNLIDSASLNILEKAYQLNLNLAKREEYLINFSSAYYHDYSYFMQTSYVINTSTTYCQRIVMLR